MEITLRERKEGFFSFLKRKRTTHINCRRTIGKVFGLGGGYKTRICADKELAEEGKVKELVDLLEREGRNTQEPFGVPLKSLDGYDLTIKGTARELRANKKLIRSMRRAIQPEYRNGFDKYVASLVGWFSIEMTRDQMAFRLSESKLAYKPIFRFLQR